jgi:hypothetical protein
MRAILVTLLLVTLGGCLPFQRSAARMVIPEKWQPTSAEITQCESAVAKKVSAEHRRLPGYYVRMYAVIRDGREVLVGFGGPKGGFGSGWYLAPEPPRDGTRPDEDPSIMMLPFTDGPDTPYFRFIFDRANAKLVSFGFSTSM